MSDDKTQDATRGLSEAPGGPEGVQPSNGGLEERLKLVAPRITCVIECSQVYTDVDIIGYRTVILGPFTKREAEAVAATLTCRHRVLTIDTQPPDWTTA